MKRNSIACVRFYLHARSVFLPNFSNREMPGSFFQAKLADSFSNFRYCPLHPAQRLEGFFQKKKKKKDRADVFSSSSTLQHLMRKNSSLLCSVLQNLRSNKLSFLKKIPFKFCYFRSQTHVCYVLKIA